MLQGREKLIGGSFVIRVGHDISACPAKGRHEHNDEGECSLFVDGAKIADYVRGGTVRRATTLGQARCRSSCRSAVIMKEVHGSST